jgi:formate hydrogenlyase subunit 3/multisubunit Na+/H+ antiporter MnhD subunit
MSQKNFALSKTNLIICGISVLLIIGGFLLMTGASSSFDRGFEPDIFSARRIKIAPMVVLSGFILMIVGILYPSKERKKDDHE